jgi:tripartite-type tricarboxylate transporter receptor subunit TctC
MRAAQKLLIYGLGMAIAAMTISALVIGASAQTPDTRPVTLVVPIAAGGGVDIIGRQFAAKLSEQLNQPWLVENRTGAGGAIGIDTVAKAESDGHTMLLMETSSVLHKWLHRDVPFDVVADFAPVAQIATTPILLFAGPASPVSDLKSLIAYAKANPGKLTVGTPGVGTPHHLAALMFNVMAGVEITHVPYKGTAPALSDLLGGQIQLIWSTPNSLMQYVETGKIKPLAVASRSRIDILPDVPTVSESGYPNFDVTVWYGVSGPAKMPADLIARYGSAIATVDKMPDVERKLTPLGYNLQYFDNKQFADTIASDYARYGKLIRDAGIKPD